MNNDDERDYAEEAANQHLLDEEKEEAEEQTLVDELHHTGKHEVDAEAEEQHQLDVAGMVIVGHAWDTGDDGSQQWTVKIGGVLWLLDYWWNEAASERQWWRAIDPPTKEELRAHPKRRSVKLVGEQWFEYVDSPFGADENYTLSDAWDERLEEFNALVVEERSLRRIPILEEQAIKMAVARHAGEPGQGWREEGITYDEWSARVNGPRIAASRRRLRETAAQGRWTPTFERWRHGGWYVTNLTYPSGAVGCVSNNYPDKKWRIVCVGATPGSTEDVTYRTRAEAAYAELALVLALPDEA